MRYIYLLLFVLLVTSCAQSSHHNDISKSTYVIGVSHVGDDAWFKMMEQEMRQEALFHPEVRLVFRNAHYDQQQQCLQIDSFIAEKIDLLIMGPTDVHRVCEASNRAYEAGVPVVMTSHYGIGEKYTAFVCMSNYEIGQALGNFLIKVSQEEKSTIQHPLCAFVIEGPSNIAPTELRSKGMWNALRDHPEIKIISTCGAEWRREDAVKITDSLLVLYPQVRAIVAQNDEMAIGAAKACAHAGAYPHIKIMGVDAMAGKDSGIEAILRGDIDASVMSTSRGDVVLKTAVAILTKSPYEKETYLPVISVNQTSPQLMLRMAEEMNSSQDAIETLQNNVNYLLGVSGGQKWLIRILIIFVLMIVAAFWGIRNIQRNRQRVRAQLEHNTQLVNKQQQQLDALTAELARTKITQSQDAQFIEHLQSYIEVHLMDNELTLERLQKELGVSRTQLFRKTKDTMGKTPIELIRHVRLYRAQKMIKDTDLSIQEIAYSVGFSSPSYFTKCYKAEFGKNPKRS